MTSTLQRFFSDMSSKGQPKMYLTKEQYLTLRDTWKQFANTKHAYAWQHLLFILLTNRSVSASFTPVIRTAKLQSCNNNPYQALEDANYTMRSRIYAASVGRVGNGKLFGSPKIEAKEPFQVSLDGIYAYPSDIPGKYSFTLTPEVANELMSLTLDKLLALERSVPFIDEQESEAAVS